MYFLDMYVFLCGRRKAAENQRKNNRKTTEKQPKTEDTQRKNNRKTSETQQNKPQKHNRKTMDRGSRIYLSF